MRDFVNQKTKNLQPSGIRKFFDIVSVTEGAISLGVGEPDFQTPWKIRQAAIKTLEKGKTTYTSNRGLIELREEIAKYFKETVDTEYDAEKEIRERRNEISKAERRLNQKEDALDKKELILDNKIESLDRTKQDLDKKREELDIRENELEYFLI